MTLINEVYDYIVNKYSTNEPIFLTELDIPGMKPVSVRQQIKKLTDDGRLKRFDTGIYYIPQKTIFRSGSTLSVDDVIRKKYLQDGVNRCGYVGGILFANQLGLTTQVPALYEVYTNKATTEYRETKLANLRVIIRKPYCEIDMENVATLQFLDLIKEVVDISEVEGEELGISFGTALIVLLALYFIIKWAVKNGIKEAYRDITGKVTTEDIEAEQICNEEEK